MGIFGKKAPAVTVEQMRADMVTHPVPWQRAGFTAHLLLTPLGSPHQNPLVLLVVESREALFLLGEIQGMLDGEFPIAETEPRRETYFLMAVASHFREDTDEIAFLGTRKPGGWRGTASEYIASTTANGIRELCDWARQGAAEERSARASGS